MMIYLHYVDILKNHLNLRHKVLAFLFVNSIYNYKFILQDNIKRKDKKIIYLRVVLDIKGRIVSVNNLVISQLIRLKRNFAYLQSLSLQTQSFIKFIYAMQDTNWSVFEFDDELH